MEDNPYSAFVDAMKQITRDAQPATIRFGVVTRAKPLLVDVGGALQEERDLVFASPSPLVSVEVDHAGQHRHLIQTSETEDAGQHSHTARVSRDLPAFQAGDALLLIPIEDEQRYIVVSRLVGL